MSGANTQDPAKLEATPEDKAMALDFLMLRLDEKYRDQIKGNLDRGEYNGMPLLELATFARHRLSHPSSATSARAEKAKGRIGKFLTEWAKMRHAGEIIHSLHNGEDREAELSVSDLRALIGTTPAPASNADLRLWNALAELTDCFLERHGCFPQDDKRWKAAMSEAYTLVGQPNTPARIALRPTTQQAEPAPLAGDVERVARALCIHAKQDPDQLDGLPQEDPKIKLAGTDEYVTHLKWHNFVSNARAAIAALSPHKAPGDAVLTIPLLNPPYAEEHPILAPIIQKRTEVAAKFTPEFSLQRGADFDRGLMCAFEVVNATLQRMTAALSPDTAPAGEGEGA